MKMNHGNRGKMKIHLIEISVLELTYKWKYLHKDDIFKSTYKTIT